MILFLKKKKSCKGISIKGLTGRGGPAAATVAGSGRGGAPVEGDLRFRPQSRSSTQAPRHVRSRWESLLLQTNQLISYCVLRQGSSS